MYRKIILALSLLTLLVLNPLAATAAPIVGTDPALSNCYIYTVDQVNEGETFTSIIKCRTISASVFGFEFGTTFTPSLAVVNGVASSPVAVQIGSTYTAGDFAPTNPLVGMNSLSNLYAVSHQGVTTSTGEFVLGSFDSIAPFGIVADTSATIDLRDLKLSDRLGSAITAPVTQDTNTVSIINLIIALRQAGSITVQSDGDMTNIRNIALNLDGGNPSTVTTATGSSKAISVAAYQYPQDKTTASISISMTSHLSCTKDITLADGANATSVLGTTYTLLAGDVNADDSIGILDATQVGSNFNTSQSGVTDINGDGTVNIYDLVHMGRNYNATSGTCS